MDTHSPLTLARNENGMVMVYIAVLLTMLFAFLALAVDVGYLDVSKTQLQTAADSAALAGASYLPDPAMARFKAMSSASRNVAAGSPVTILNNGTNTLSDVNDVTLGNFNRNLNPHYVPGGSANRPINAVQVQTRRTQDTTSAAQQSKIELFFGQLFGHPTMGVSAAAIAQRLPSAGAHFLLSRTVCPLLPAEGHASATLSPPLSLSPTAANMAWSSLLEPATSASAVEKLICGPIPDVKVCAGEMGKDIYTTSGTAAADFKDMESVFYDPSYDRKNKTFTADGTVATWTLIVPVANVDDPTSQPGAIPVLGYAKIRMIRACGTGGGGGSACMPYSSPKGQSAVCSPSENDIVIDWIECVTCAASDSMLGAVPTLAQ